MNEVDKPPTPKNAGKLVGFVYVTMNREGKADIEVGHAFPHDKEIRQRLFEAMISAVETERRMP